MKKHRKLAKVRISKEKQKEREFNTNQLMQFDMLKYNIIQEFHIHNVNTLRAMAQNFTNSIY